MSNNPIRANACIVMLLTLLLATACRKEDRMPLPTDPNPQSAVSKVQFAAAQWQVAENHGQYAVDIQLHPRAARAGVLRIQVEEQQAQAQVDYVAAPAAVNGVIELAVPAGADKVSIHVTPIDNQVVNTMPRQLKFTLSAVEGSPFRPEGNTSATLNILDDEQASQVRFEQAERLIYEQQEGGTVITLLLQPAAHESGFIDVVLSSEESVQGRHFHTQPAFAENRQRLWVAAGAQSVQFQVKPVNDLALNPDRKIRFEVVATSPHFTVAGSAQMMLTIRDNGSSERINIRSMRESFRGQPLIYFYPHSIRGRVISVNDNVAEKVAYIEDETGGIAVAFQRHHGLAIGHMVTINLENTVLGMEGDVLQLKQAEPGRVLQHGFENWTVPDLTLQALLQQPRNWEGKMVTVTDVVFPQANGVATLLGDVVIRSVNGLQTARVRTEPMASWTNQLIPAGRRSVTGIVLHTPSGWTLLPQFASDIR